MGRFANMRRQKISIETNGKYKGTTLLIDDHPIYFDSLTINGSKESDFDIVIGISNGKLTKQEIRQECGQDAIGFAQETEEYWEDE